MGILKRVNNFCTYRGKKLQKPPPAPKIHHNQSDKSQNSSGILSRVYAGAKQKWRKSSPVTGPLDHVFTEASNTSSDTFVEKNSAGPMSPCDNNDDCQERPDLVLSQNGVNHSKTSIDSPPAQPAPAQCPPQDGTPPGREVQTKIDYPPSKAFTPKAAAECHTVGSSSEHDSLFDQQGESDGPSPIVKKPKLRRMWGKVKGMAQHTVNMVPCFKSQELEHVEASVLCVKNQEDDTADSDDDEDRCQWNVLHSIPNETYKSLIRSLPFAATFRDVFVPGVTNGSYHFVVFVKALNDGYFLEDYVIKIPGQGTPGRWTDEDSYMLEREVDTMRLVQSCTTIPVPEIMAWSSDINNPFGFPYIIMRRLPGNDATKIWYDQPHNQNDPDHITDFVSPETEKKRLTFLRSLAQNMTQLNNISFEGIGLPCQGKDDQLSFPLPVGKGYLWNSSTDVHAVEVREPTKTTPDYIRRARADFNAPQVDANGKYSRSEQALAGIHKLLDIAFSHPVFQTKPNDTFVLQHSDLDLQNILTDNEGIVTGIIDWDGSIAAPRCVGHAALPNFLCHNWFPDHGDDRLVLRTDHYRDVYAAAMVEAGNPDAKYTSKSAMYQALIAAIYEGGSIYNITDKLLSEIPGCRTPGRQIATFLGSSTNLKLEQALKTELYKVLEPQLPCLSIKEALADVSEQV